MKRLFFILLLLPIFSAGQFVIWDNQIYFKTSPTDSSLYGPSYLQPLIEKIKQLFDNTETGKLNNPIPEGTIGVPFWRRVSGSNVTTTGQTLTDVTGLSAALVANSIYQFEANLSVSTSAVTTGVQYGVNYSAAGATIEANIVGASSTTASKTERISVLNTATTTFLATSAQSGGIRITGSVITGANAGNLTIKHLKVTSGTSTVFINSFLKVTRIQ